MWAIKARRITFALFVFSMFFWGYVVVRILSGIVQPSDYFIDNLPVVLGIELTFLNLGIITFVLGFIFFLAYLLLEELELVQLTHCHECEAEFIGPNWLDDMPDDVKHALRHAGYGKEIG